MMLIGRNMAIPVEVSNNNNNNNGLADMDMAADNYSVTIIHNYAETPSPNSQKTEMLLLAILAQIINSQNFQKDTSTANNVNDKFNAPSVAGVKL